MVGNTSLMTISRYFENHSSRVSFQNEGLQQLSLATPPIGTEMLCCSKWNKTSGFRIEYFLGSGLCSLVQQKNHPKTPAEGYLSFHTINTGARYSKKRGKGTKSLWAMLLYGKKIIFSVQYNFLHVPLDVFIRKNKKCTREILIKRPRFSVWQWTASIGRSALRLRLRGSRRERETNLNRRNGCYYAIEKKQIEERER
jgi:hypothetical protein